MTTTTAAARRFPSPFDVTTPVGAEGWERMYPPYLLFSQENREWEDGQFWFYDALHRPDVEYPFDTIIHEAWTIALGAFSGRVFTLPGTRGFAHRILNGRLYLSNVAIEDPAEIESRIPTFTARAGFYYARWDELFGSWRTKMEAVTRDLAALAVPALPDIEDEKVTTDAIGVSTVHGLLTSYAAAVESVFRAYQHHFEMHLLGYGAYLNLFGFCRKAFPGITDQTIASMASGADLLMFRPDDELKKLAALALELGIADRIRADAPPADIVRHLRQEHVAAPWIAAFDGAQDPWFHFSSGTGLYHNERSWLDDLSVPWPVLRSYVDRLEHGESIDRPHDAIMARRERLAEEYSALLPDEGDRQAFLESVELARTVASYVEDHNFYIEHWHHTVFWNKMREFGGFLARNAFLDDPDDLFFLNRWEVGQALHDASVVWSTGAPGRPAHWQALIAERKPILDALRAASPEPALGPVPGAMDEPFAIMLWGLTDEQVESWLADDDDGSHELRGFAGSPGVVEGVARVLHSPAELAKLQDGEILVCPVTAPSWGPVFGRIGAAVTDTGGIMCHAAIVCREYGLPAVVGTGRGTQRIRTGDRLLVDGDAGVVTLLDPA